jgi:5'-methylthioadenosine phosphorylase
MNKEQNRLGVIGGSQAYALLRKGAIKGKRLGPRDTPFGPSEPIFEARFSPSAPEVYFLSRHGESRYSVAASFVNYRANIYALRDAGVTRVISWSGPGAINTGYAVGDFVVIDDVIDETRRRAGTFFEGRGIGFVRQSPTFCPALRRAIVGALEGVGAKHWEGGTYVCTEGPRLETAAEIRKYKACGGDLVGMTLVPEVFLAKELEMCCAAICYVTNYAEGVRGEGEGDFEAGRLFEGLASEQEMRKVEESVALFPEIISRIAASLADAQRDCHCPRLMERYRKRGDISGDWREWVTK